MDRQPDNDWIVYVATFPPRACGIATFTQDLGEAIDQLSEPALDWRVIALNTTEVAPFQYPKRVLAQIAQDRVADYTAAAELLNHRPEVRIVNVQHEFGIFGGQDGEYLLRFLKTIRKPVVTTFHTVLPEPTTHQRQVVREIANFSARVIAMTKASQRLLQEKYDIPKTQIVTIPHGTHPVPFRTSGRAKARLELGQKRILTTFGLLSRGKGIEYVLDALPPIVAKFTDVLYLVVGATHPMVLREEGEAYRNELIEQVYRLGLHHHVRFYNSYLALPDLLSFLEATDIYLAPSLNPNHTVSGTLSYALSVGRPVIATNFAQAQEIVTPEVGIRVDFRNPNAISEALSQLLGDEQRRRTMARAAYASTRPMTWPNVAAVYLKTFAKHAPRLRLIRKLIPSIKLHHLFRLTDEFGIVQFATLTDPDRSSGYTLDDNARALIVATECYDRFKTAVTLKLAGVYLKFLERVSSPNGWINYVAGDRRPDQSRNTQENLEDARGRALWALGVVLGSKLPKRYKQRARRLFEAALPQCASFTSPRAVAFSLKGIGRLLHKWPNPRLAGILTRQCNWLVGLYQNSRAPDWEWFEEHLTYSNAVLPEALLLGYATTRNQAYLKVARATLDFLIANTFVATTYVPIGQEGWYRRGRPRRYFDQQPEDVAATVCALSQMTRVTGEDQYRRLRDLAFEWFLGNNTLSQVVYDRVSGGCYDGISRNQVNINQGAESTVSYLLARLALLDADH